MSLTAVVRRQLWKFELLNRNSFQEKFILSGKRKPWNRNVFSSETKRQKHTSTLTGNSRMNVVNRSVNDYERASRNSRRLRNIRHRTSPIDKNGQEPVTFARDHHAFLAGFPGAMLLRLWRS